MDLCATSAMFDTSHASPGSDGVQYHSESDESQDSSEEDSEEDIPLGLLSFENDWDLEQAKRFNGESPKLINACIHQLFGQQAQRQPNATAIDSWDGLLTYSDLEYASNRLSHCLVDTFDLQPHDLVHVCFEKSIWAYVSILAINKAGAAWVPLDPGHPRQRQQQVIQQTRSHLVLTSPKNANVCGGLIPKILEVTSSLDLQLVRRYGYGPSAPQIVTTPKHAAYVIFTSGSTGVPKGVVMEHGSVCTSQTAIRDRLKITPAVRILQFASYVFDVCVGEIVAPLISGATVCVPSDEIRMNGGLAKFMNAKRVNWAFLTSSFARLLKPHDTPGLELLLLTGEAVSRDVFETWIGSVRLIAGWGPAETCVFSTLHEWRTIDESHQTIGRPVGGYCWIVEPEQPHKLAPIGCIGEILIQGPTLLREYLADPARTTASTVTRLPEWVPNSTTPSWNRFYKTGDLCYYNSDGSIQFVSRKDTQVKIRGLRVELGEVEHHFRAALPTAIQVVVEVFERSSGPILAAYFCFDHIHCIPTTELHFDDVFLPLTDDLRNQIITAIGQMSVVVPGYMIPTAFFPCRFIPSVSSAKVDRGALKNLSVKLSPALLAAYCLTDQDKRAPRTPMEARIQEIWSKILNIPTKFIGCDDSFVHLGGDSITALRFVALTEEIGLKITVKDIFTDPRLCIIATKITEIEHVSPSQIKRLELLPDAEASDFKTATLEQCNISNESEIEDAYPCTSLQEGLIALSIKQPRSYMARFVLELQDVNLSRFKDALNTTVAACTNLRTRIIHYSRGFAQVILRQGPIWREVDIISREDALKLPLPHAGYGTPLSFFMLASDSNKTYLIWDLHHSIYDGWTLGCMLDILHKEYSHQGYFEPVDFSNYIGYTLSSNMEEMQDYWRSSLQGANTSKFPSNDLMLCDTRSPNTFIAKMMVPHRRTMNVTISSILRAAWAIVLARYLDTNDVVFGSTVSGRNAPVPGIQAILGPTIATVPVRIRVRATATIGQFLSSVQSQANSMIPFEHIGLQNISKMGEDAREACDFRNLLLIQPTVNDKLDSRPAFKLMDVEDEPANTQNDNYDTYPLVFQCSFGDNGAVVASAHYDAQWISSEQITWLCKHFEHVVLQLATRDDNLALSHISLFTHHDADQIYKWNSERIPQNISACVHDLIWSHAVWDPRRQAIFSSDGNITYQELDEISTRLASYLCRIGIAPESIVPICLEKSKWAPVVMIAIMKAGAAYLPLDPSHPSNRLRALCNEVAARFIVTSPKVNTSWAESTLDCIRISDSFVSQLPKLVDINTLLPRSNPQSPAYVLCTSGTTGRPKGVIIQHSALSSSIKGHGTAYGLNSDSRVLQFSNYIFDGSIAEIFTPLVFGGTICVPSEIERLENITSFVNEAGVNIAMLTPSFARTLRPQDMPSLSTLVLGGEALSKDNLKTWYGLVKLINAYGPTEACVDATSHLIQSLEESASNIGRSQNSTCWIVDADDHHQLAPLGCVGELLVQGPTLAQGYFNDPKKTDAAFLEDIDWLPPSFGQTRKRFYKTGDLVSYNSDGTINYIGRKDTQIKIRGLRIELGEIEYKIKESLSTIENAIVGLVQRDKSDLLVAFITFIGQTGRNNIPHEVYNLSDFLLPLESTVEKSTATIVADLKRTLPKYMIPNVFFPIRDMPFISSMKIDRFKLCRGASELPTERLLEYTTKNTRVVIRQPLTKQQHRLRSFWSEVLSIQEDLIGIDDNFYILGGDSIRLISLAKLIYKEYNIPLAQGYLNDKSLTVFGLSEYIEHSDLRDKGPIEVDLMSELSSIFSTSLSEYSQGLINYRTSLLPQNSTVFLTGATGYLGMEILRQLLNVNSVGKVITLVRARSPEQGLDRIMKRASIFEWWDASLHRSKIEIWTGDLSDPHLGLNDHQWGRIRGVAGSKNVDAIIHNGAIVNWNADFNTLRAANVDSTVSLLRAAASSPLEPKFVYISGAVKAKTQKDVSGNAAFLSKSSGYNQTKFLSEATIQSFTNRLPADQNHFSTVKPGFIIGSINKGIANVDDFLWRLVSAVSQMQTYPQEPSEHWLQVSDVETVTNTILHQLFTTGQVAPFIEISSCIPVASFWESVNAELGIQCAPIPLEKWIPLALSHIEKVGETHPLWPVQHFLGHLGTPLSQDNIAPASKQVFQLQRAIKSNVKYLKSIGFICSVGQGMNLATNIAKRSNFYQT